MQPTNNNPLISPRRLENTDSTSPNGSSAIPSNTPTVSQETNAGISAEGRHVRVKSKALSQSPSDNDYSPSKHAHKKVDGNLPALELRRISKTTWVTNSIDSVPNPDTTVRLENFQIYANTLNTQLHLLTTYKNLSDLTLTTDLPINQILPQILERLPHLKHLIINVTSPKKLTARALFSPEALAVRTHTSKFEFHFVNQPIHDEHRNTPATQEQTMQVGICSGSQKEAEYIVSKLMEFGQASILVDIVHTHVSQEVLQQLSLLPNLLGLCIRNRQQLDFKSIVVLDGFKRLQFLDVSECLSINDASIQALGTLYNLTHLTIRDFTSESFLEGFKSLNVLEVRAGILSVNIASALLKLKPITLNWNDSTLCLSLSDHPAIIEAAIQFLSNNLGKTDYVFVGNGSLESLIRGCPDAFDSMQAIDLSMCTHITDSDIFALGFMPELKTLILRDLLSENFLDRTSADVLNDMSPADPYAELSTSLLKTFIKLNHLHIKYGSISINLMELLKIEKPELHITYDSIRACLTLSRNNALKEIALGILENPNIQDLTLKGTGHLKYYETTDERRDNIITYAQYLITPAFKNITKLDVSGCIELEAMDLDAIDEEAPQLKTLKIRNLTTYETADLLIDKFINLQTLYIQEGSVSEDILTELVNLRPGLKIYINCSPQYILEDPEYVADRLATAFFQKIKDAQCLFNIFKLFKPDLGIKLIKRSDYIGVEPVVDPDFVIDSNATMFQHGYLKRANTLLSRMVSTVLLDLTQLSLLSDAFVADCMYVTDYVSPDTPTFAYTSMFPA